MDGECAVVASVATIDGRQASLAKTVASLLPQVDRLIVTLNGSFDPQLPEDTRLRVVRNAQNRGDQEKLLALRDVQARWLLSCDDDLIYPPDYVECMVKARRRLDGPVSAHGALLRHPFVSYYDSRHQMHCCGVTRQTKAHIIGSGCACFDPDDIVWSPWDFEVPNMADIWLAITLARAKISRYVIGHAAGWMKLADPKNEQTIWHASRRHDGSMMDTGQQQTDAIVQHLELFR